MEKHLKIIIEWLMDAWMVRGMFYKSMYLYNNNNNNNNNNKTI